MFVVIIVNTSQLSVNELTKELMKATETAVTVCVHACIYMCMPQQEDIEYCNCKLYRITCMFIQHYIGKLAQELEVQDKKNAEAVQVHTYIHTRAFLDVLYFIICALIVLYHACLSCISIYMYLWSYIYVIICKL